MLHINEIIHRYKSGFELHISDLDLPKNHIIGLVGANGSGKTTLMSILSGFLAPSSELNISYTDGQPSILFIPSDIEMYEFLTVGELLRLMKKYADASIDEKSILETLDLTSKVDCQIDELSLGMRKKLTLMPMLLKHYDLIILDEPFNSIDMAYIYKLKQLIKSLRSTSTILLSSHILETLADLCDSFILISDGSVRKCFQNSGDIREIEGEIFD